MKATLVYPLKANYTLMATKLKKVGRDKLNGFGGKPKPKDISIRHTATREFMEEAGSEINTKPENLVIRAEIDFYNFDNKTNEPNWSVVIFTVRDFTGLAETTLEMEKPLYYDINDLPFEDMMPADCEFLPRVLSNGPTFRGTVRFNADMTAVTESSYYDIALEV